MTYYYKEMMTIIDILTCEHVRKCVLLFLKGKAFLSCPLRLSGRAEEGKTKSRQLVKKSDTVSRRQKGKPWSAGQASEGQTTGWHPRKETP